MDTIKKWLIDYAVKTGGPSAIRNGVLLLAGWLVVHAELLSKMGVTYDQIANKVTIDLNTANMYLLALLPMAGAAIISILNSHAKDVVLTKQPPASVPPPTVTP